MLIEKARARLEALSRLVPRLHEAADAYMAELKRIERRLKKLNVGTAIELEGSIQRSNSTSQYNDDGKSRRVFHYAWALAYGEDHRGRWCLLVRKYEVDETSNVWAELDVTPLLQAPRGLRLAAAERIPELLKAIEEEVEKKTETLARANQQALKFSAAKEQKSLPWHIPSRIAVFLERRLRFLRLISAMCSPVFATL